MRHIIFKSLFYDGDNLSFLDEVLELVDMEQDKILFRASELSELSRILTYGTDRGGYSDRMWDDNIKYEDVVFGTTVKDIIIGEEENKSSSFKKFDIIDEPILLIYEKNGFENVDNHQWKFVEIDNKIDKLKYIIILC